MPALNGGRASITLPSGFQLYVNLFLGPSAAIPGSPVKGSPFSLEQLKRPSPAGSTAEKDQNPGIIPYFALAHAGRNPSPDEGFFKGTKNQILLLSPDSARLSARPAGKPMEPPPKANPQYIGEAEVFRNQYASTFTRLKRAEALSLASQLAGLAALQAVDVWDNGHRPFADYKNSLRRAWTEGPSWDDDPAGFNYIGHPYTGSFTYNLMRSQAASPLASWLFSTSQSLIWEFVLEATEEQPSGQDLLITSNVGALIGEAFHNITLGMRENGFSLTEKIIVFIINPAFVLNNGFN